ncbi:MAG: hypothetical protein R2776_10190 [Flavobacteriaceae bacterium]|nr:hypothetical protein [Flavobacteriaceae bacterium]
MNKEIIAQDGKNVETLVLGSSQMMNAVNPEWMHTRTLNLASGDQHHDTDFKLYQQLHSQFPNLNTVVLEVSYSHFEMPHNGKDFWKNSLYYHYYQVNCFERAAYFKDQLLYLSNTAFFWKMINEYYIKKSNIPKINKYGFNETDGYQQFAKLGFIKEKIDAMPRFKINTTPNLKIFKENIILFFELLDTLQDQQKQVVICSPPMYNTYLKRRNPEILKRRDSIIQIIKLKYPKVTFLNAEEDTLHYSLDNFWNQSHLNPKGANIFTQQLDSVIQKFD